MNRSSGQSTIELTLGLTIFVALALASVDLFSILFAGSSTDSILRQSLRLAARQHLRPAARLAFEQSLGDYRRAKVFAQLKLVDFEFDEAKSGKVSATVSSTVNLPVPMAGWSTVTFNMTAEEAVTAFLSQSETVGTK